MLLLVVLSLDCGTDGWTTARRLNSPLRCHSVCGLTQNRGPRAAGKKKAACARPREGAASAPGCFACVWFGE